MKRNDRLAQFYAILERAEGWLPLRAVCDRAGVVKADWARQVMNTLIVEGWVQSKPVTYTNGVIGIVYAIDRQIDDSYEEIE